MIKVKGRLIFMKCPGCGKENQQDAAFCMACGKPMPGTPFEAVSTGVAGPPGEKALRGYGEETGRREGMGGEEMASASPGPGAAGHIPRPGGSGGRGGTTPHEEGYKIVSPGGFVFGGAPSGSAAVPPSTGEAEETGPAVKDVSESAAGEMLPTAESAETPPIPPRPEGLTPPAGPVAEEAAGPVTGIAGVPEEGRTVVLPGPASVSGPAVAPPGGPSPASGPGTGEGTGDAICAGGSLYIPPEADYGKGLTTPEPVASEGFSPPQGNTVAMEPVAAPRAVPRRSRVICPECYASNPEENSYCQECGSLLPMAALRQPPEARQQGQATYPRTAVFPASGPEFAPTGGAEAYPATQAAGKARTPRSFSLADALALPALALLAAALLLPSFMEGFSYKKGVDIGLFAHQGSYVRGRPDLLGGPGLLPYRGAEFLTVGLIAALGLGLAFLFMLIRTGRGPMYLLAGTILLLPLIYSFFQAILPLREQGVQIEPAVGLGRLFSGGQGIPGLGPPFWMIAGAGVILVLCGFLAPPRGWGRLFSFLLFFSLATGAGFLCAACYNWNLFITGDVLGKVPEIAAVLLSGPASIA